MEWLTELITTMHWGAVAQIIMIDILSVSYTHLRAHET